MGYVCKEISWTGILIGKLYPRYIRHGHKNGITMDLEFGDVRLDQVTYELASGKLI